MLCIALLYMRFDSCTNERAVKCNLRTGPLKTCCAKGEDAVNHNTVTRWLKKFCLGCKNRNQTRSGRSITVSSKSE